VGDLTMVIPVDDGGCWWW